MATLIQNFESTGFLILLGGFLTLLVLWLRGQARNQELENLMRGKDIEAKKLQNEKRILNTPLDELVDEFDKDFGPGTRKNGKPDSSE